MLSIQKCAVLLLVVLMVLMGASVSHAQEDESTCDGLLFAGGWSRPAVTAGGNGTGVVYGIFINLNAEDDSLLGGSSEIASNLELHQTTMDEQGVMQMQPVSEAMAVTQGGAIIFEPGGYHIMLIGLQRDLLEGDTFDITLSFEKAGDVTVTSTVQFDPPTGEEDAIQATGNTEGCASVGFYGATASALTEGESHVIYGVLVNLSEEAHTVSAVSTPAAERVQLYETDHDDPSVMHDLTEGVTLAPGGFVVLKANGVHMAVTGLAGVEIEQAFDLYLTVDGEDSGPFPVWLVEADDTMPAMEHDMSSMEGDQSHAHQH